LVFGETFVGKSSIVNMLAERELAAVSSGAGVCTFQNRHYHIRVGDYCINLYDTVGLNAPFQGKPSWPQAVAMLFGLIRNLAETDGIDFLVMVVRKPAIFKEFTVQNYNLFYNVFCASQVPLVIVITGMDFDDPTTWWNQNQNEFTTRGITFKAHACLTATRGKQTSDGYLLQQEYASSTEILRNLVLSQCQSNEPWKQDIGVWFRSTLRYLRSTLAVFLDKRTETRRKLRDALVEHAKLSRSQAKDLAARIINEFNTA
jgi:tRNA U34 5-carboxymethylaminomethyl modifying GTPase MnmE/TrmE